MSKLTCLVLGVVAVSLSSVHFTKAESLRDSLRPVIVACGQEHGVTDTEIQAAKDAGSAASIKPCFLGCVFKKAGFLNDKGDYDLDIGLKNLRQFVKDDEQYNKLADVAKQCSSVNFKTVSDGTAGCERGALLAGCLLEHRTSVTRADKPTLRDNLKPIIEECLKEIPGVTNDDINKAAEDGDPSNLHPCFSGCIFKKAGFINDKGEYDLNTGLINFRKIVKDDEEYTKLKEVATECTRVKHTGSDGETGCERGNLLSTCFLQHKDKILI